jgi:hypothetical protein
MELGVRLGHCTYIKSVTLYEKDVTTSTLMHAALTRSRKRLHAHLYLIMTFCIFASMIIQHFNLENRIPAHQTSLIPPLFRKENIQNNKTKYLIGYLVLYFEIRLFRTTYWSVRRFCHPIRGHLRSSHRSAERSLAWHTELRIAESFSAIRIRYT